MSNVTANYSLYINSLLSSKELKIKSNDTLQIVESSVFKNAKTIIPIDLIETHAKKGSQLDYQWIIFGLVSFIAASIFMLLALTQQFTSILILGAIFAILSVSSIFLSFKFRNITHTYQYKGTSMNLFTLTETDLNSKQITEFVENLNTNDLKTHVEMNHAVDLDNSFNTAEDKQNDRLNVFYESLILLNQEDIISDKLLESLQQKAYNKVYPLSSHDYPDHSDELHQNDNVIAFPITGTK